jgi:hypothetical protein
MSLRIRRGTEAQRTGATFDLGEIVYTTDTNKLYVGDGVNLGGKNILATSAGTGLIWNATTQRLDYNGSGTGIVSVQADANPTLGGNLNLNNRNITGSGNINISGTVTATQFVGTRVSADTSPQLGGNLNLNNRNITGIGNISNTGTITTTSIITNGALTVGGGVAGVLTANYVSGGASAINLSSSNNGAVNIQSFTTNGSNVNSVNLSIQVSRGSVAAPTTVLANDVLGGIIISGYNGTSYKPAGFITSQLDATSVLSDVYPASSIGFGSGGGGSVINIAKLDARGRWNSPRLQITAYATGSYPSSPIQGEIIFDSTTKKFMGHNGTAWVEFTGP